METVAPIKTKTTLSRSKISKNINNTRTLFAMADKLTNPTNQIVPESLTASNLLAILMKTVHQVKYPHKSAK